ncbi:MAG: hypothetical protein M1296_06315 [Chloroflexi bacterium]|nr:hypothetical protein [Chloroflexota bacterium]
MVAPLFSVSPDAAELRRGLNVLRQAQRLTESVRWAIRGAIAGLALTALLLALARVVTLSTSVALAVTPAAAAVAALAAATRRRSLTQVALLADRRLGLQERLTTAWELAGQENPVALARVQLADALARLSRVRPFQAFPLRLSWRESAVMAGLAGLVIILLVLPNPHLRDAQQQHMQRQLLQQQAQAVGQLARQIQSAAGNTPTAEQKATLVALHDLEQSLKKGDVQQAEQALVAAEDQLRANSSGTAVSTQAALDRAAAALTGSQGNHSLTKSLAQAIGAGQYAQAAQQLQQLGNQALSLPQSERDALQSTLRNAGAAAAKSDPALGQALQQAAVSLGSISQPGDSATVRQAFQQASAALQQAGRSVQSESQLQQALSQVQVSENALGTQSSPGATGQQSQNSSGGVAHQVVTLGQGAGSLQQPGQSGASQQGNGPSSSSRQQGAQSGSGQSNGQRQGDGQGSGSRSNQVYAPKPVTGHLEQLPNSAQGPGVQVAANGIEQQPADNGTIVPYTRVIAQYRSQAVQAMDRSHVPLDKKDLVRNYFSALAAGQ